MKQFSRTLTLTALACLMIGCASKPTNPEDPYEGLNRNVYKLNNTIDHTLYRPVAKIYKFIVPEFLRKGVTNVFKNIGETTTAANDALQAKPRYVMIDLTRFVVNTTIGLGGLFDVAEHLGLAKHTNDFGRTMAYYSQNKNSAYLVLPLLGPSTIRDAIGLGMAVGTDPLIYFKSDAITYGGTALEYVDLRARFLDLDKMIDSAFDPYAAVRDAYLSRRKAIIALNDKQGDYKSGQGNDEQDLDDYIQHGTNTDTGGANDPLEEFSFGDEPKQQKAVAPPKPSTTKQ